MGSAGITFVLWGLCQWTVVLKPKDNTENELKVLQHAYSVTVDLTDNVPLKSLIGFAWTGYLAKLKDVEGRVDWGCGGDILCVSRGQQ